MEDTSSPNVVSPQNKLSIIGLLLFIVALKLAAIRFFSLHGFNQNKHIPFQETIRWFDSHFANYLQDPVLTAIILILAAISLVVSITGYKLANKTFKLVSTFVIGVSSIIIVLQVLLMF